MDTKDLNEQRVDVKWNRFERAWVEQQEEITRLRAELEASQAREAQMREAVMQASHAWGHSEFPSVMVNAALAQPQDTAALDARIRAERAKERENVVNADAARLDFIERKTRESRTGVSFDWAKYAEEGCVLEHGYRMMRYSKLHERQPNLRAAIDDAMGDE